MANVSLSNIRIVVILYIFKIFLYCAIVKQKLNESNYLISFLENKKDNFTII